MEKHQLTKESSKSERKQQENYKTTKKQSVRWHWWQWHPTPVLLPGEPQGQGSLVGCRLWGRTEADTTEAT